MAAGGGVVTGGLDCEIGWVAGAAGAGVGVGEGEGVDSDAGGLAGIGGVEGDGEEAVGLFPGEVTLGSKEPCWEVSTLRNSFR